MLDKLSRKFSDILRQVSGRANISEKNIQDALNEIKIALLEADVNLRVVRRFINQTAEESLGERVVRSVSPGQQFAKIIFDKMVDLLGAGRQDLKLKGPDTLSVILLLGLQGSGKTTTAAKLALKLKSEGRTPLLIAADLTRPAAIEQLQVLAKNAEVPVYTENIKKPVIIIKNALNLARKRGINTAIIDTSGRLQIDGQLMQEIEDIKAISKPNEVLLVADAMTGQGATDIAQEFDQRVGLTGIVLSKFDSDARGGAALSIKSITGKVIKFIGTGEKLDDLEPFYPDRIASRILGMGDIVSLVEKAQETVKEEEAEKLLKKIETKTFTLADFLNQFRNIRRMGSLQSITEMIPGLQGNIPEEGVAEREMKKNEAIILSMTPEERQNYRIIGPSRRKRVAKGSGNSVHDVNKLIKQFEKTRMMMKKMSKNQKYQTNMLSHFGVQ